MPSCIVIEFYNGYDYYAFGMQLIGKEEDEKLLTDHSLLDKRLELIEIVT